MKARQKALVYRSRDEADWTEAKRLLDEAGIPQFPFAAEESPVAGCGIKTTPGRLFRREAVPTVIYRIEVAEEDRARAENVLRGKVRPVAGCGFSI